MAQVESSTNQNGSVVLQAIKSMEEPSTIRNIIDYIAIRSGIEPNEELEHNVKRTVKGGVRYGYLQEEDGKYFAAPLEGFSDEETEGQETNAIPEDRTGGRRRRRRSVRRSSHSRSRSRSRRRRRH